MFSVYPWVMAGPPPHRTALQKVRDGLAALPAHEQAGVVREACERLGLHVSVPYRSCDVRPGTVRRLPTRRCKADAVPLLVL